ncbi:lipid A 1-phosphatase LpxE, partial [Helicobacter pylori]
AGLGTGMLCVGLFTSPKNLN